MNSGNPQSPMIVEAIEAEELWAAIPQLTQRIPCHRVAILIDLLGEPRGSGAPLIVRGCRHLDGHLVAAAAARPTAGGLAVLCCLLGENESTLPHVIETLQSVEAVLSAQNINFLQAVSGDAWTEKWLVEGQFERLTELRYLEGHAPAHWELRSNQFVAMSWDASETAALLEATFQGSLDCPRLSDFRTAVETLQGYHALPGFDPQGWRTLVVDGRPAGLLVVTPTRGGDVCELTYMGVISSMRGRGLGRVLLREAQTVCRELGKSRLVLGVDAQNLPARRLYESHGFFEFDREVFFGKQLTSIGSAAQIDPSDCP